MRMNEVIVAIGSIVLVILLSVLTYYLLERANGFLKKPIEKKDNAELG